MSWQEGIAVLLPWYVLIILDDIRHTSSRITSLGGSTRRNSFYKSYFMSKRVIIKPAVTRKKTPQLLEDEMQIVAVRDDKGVDRAANNARQMLDLGDALLPPDRAIGRQK